MEQSQMGQKPVDKGVAALDLIPFAMKQSQYTPQNQEESRKLGYWKKSTRKTSYLGYGGGLGEAKTKKDEELVEFLASSSCLQRVCIQA